MGVNVTETRIESPPVHHLAKPGIAQSAPLAQPRPVFVGPMVLPADAKVAIKGRRGLVAVRTRTWPTALAEDDRDLEVSVEISDS